MRFTRTALWSHDPIAPPADTDGGAVEAGYVSVGYLSRLTADDRADLDAAEATLASLLDG